MGMIKLLAAPIGSIARFPLFQFAFVVALTLLLPAADDKSVLGQIFNGLDKLVESTVGLLSTVFNVKSFTKSWLTSSFWIGSATHTPRDDKLCGRNFARRRSATDLSSFSHPDLACRADKKVDLIINWPAFALLLFG